MIGLYVNKRMNIEMEVIWSLDRGHNIPMDIIRYIISEWIAYPPIKNNQQFRDHIELWFEEAPEKQEERNAMIKIFGHISDWNTKNVTDMRGAFEYRFTFSEDLSKWNVSNVKDMYFMFAFCSKFQSDLSRWDVSQVENMSCMFYDSTLFTSDLSKWNVHNVTDLSGMFSSCSQFNSDLSQWDVRHVIYMQALFSHCHSFDCDLSNWKIAQVKNMKDIFIACDNLQNIANIQNQWLILNPNIIF